MSRPYLSLASFLAHSSGDLKEVVKVLLQAVQVVDPLFLRGTCRL
jgi:hypothetical protein